MRNYVVTYLHNYFILRKVHYRLYLLGLREIIIIAYNSLQYILIGNTILNLIKNIIDNIRII